MASPRLYVDMSLASGEKLTLPKGPAHHLATVLRQKSGNPVVLFNGHGGEFHGVLAQCDRKAVIVELQDFVEIDRSPPLSIHLGMCILKKDPMDAVLGRVVELGVFEITPIISDRCSVSTKVIRSRMDHWRAVVISSCEQCGLNRIPRFNEPATSENWIETADAEQKIIALPGESPLTTGLSAKTANLFVGPEGGFSDREIELAVNSGFQTTTFGERILRAETAPAVAIAILHHAWGDF